MSPKLLITFLLICFSEFLLAQSIHKQDKNIRQIKEKFSIGDELHYKTSLYNSEGYLIKEEFIDTFYFFKSGEIAIYSHIKLFRYNALDSVELVEEFYLQNSSLQNRVSDYRFFSKLGLRDSSVISLFSTSNSPRTDTLRIKYYRPKINTEIEVNAAGRMVDSTIIFRSKSSIDSVQYYHYSKDTSKYNKPILAYKEHYEYFNFKDSSKRRIITINPSLLQGMMRDTITLTTIHKKSGDIAELYDVVMDKNNQSRKLVKRSIYKNGVMIREEERSEFDDSIISKLKVFEYDYY